MTGDVYTPSDVEEIQELIGALTGHQLQELDAALSENRDGVMALAKRVAGNPNVNSPVAVFIAALRAGDHRRRRRASMSQNDTGHQPIRVTPEDAFRRLYEAKAGDLAQYEIPVARRRIMALDYAAGEVWRCSLTRMPDGGVLELERALCEELGIDRFTGEKHRS